MVPTASTRVVAGDSSQGQPTPAANSLATENVPVAQIENQPPDPVSAGDQTPSAAGANSNQTPGGAAATPAPDPFDPAALGLSQDYAATDGLKRVLLSLAVRKPANLNCAPSVAGYIGFRIAESGRWRCAP